MNRKQRFGCWLGAALTTLLVTAGLALLPPPLQARPAGVSSPGLWKSGCFCHGEPYAGTVVSSATLDLPLTVTAGSTISLSAAITGTTDQPGPLGLGGGLDLAASRGLLLPGPTSRYITGSLEVTHLTRTNTSWTLSWQAPLTNGPVTFQGALLLANGDGKNTYDHWVLISRTLTVVGGVEVLFVPIAPFNARS
ncbi:MAG: hypothetical protein KatS3mg061_1345 [Dehalococcoidia bacterium]|nr:MAG: hypothetical protein KatS3mg061_1345 [Dehalococcoidia bacterium]